MNNPELFNGDGQTVWLDISVGGSLVKQWSRDILDYGSYQTVYLKDDNNGSDEYVFTYYNNSNSSENVQVKFEIKSFVCVGEALEEYILKKTYTSKVFTLPRKDPLIYIAESQESTFPNPGNPGTTIKFQLPQAGAVSLKVVNVRGEVVRTLINSEKAAGVHELYWDGYSDRGKIVSTGVYFFVFRAGGKVFNKKYSLVK